MQHRGSIKRAWTKMASVRLFEAQSKSFPPICKQKKQDMYTTTTSIENMHGVFWYLCQDPGRVSVTQELEDHVVPLTPGNPTISILVVFVENLLDFQLLVICHGVLRLLQ